MTNPNSTIKLSVTIGKITDATNLYIANNEYTELCNILRDIDAKMERYIFIEMVANQDIEWKTTIPVMYKLLRELRETKLVETLHRWHYIENNGVESIPELTTLVKDFNLYLDRLNVVNPFI